MTSSIDMQDHGPRFSAADVRRRAEARLSLALPPISADPALKPRHGDHILNPNLFKPGVAALAAPAAVLVPIVAREEGANILLTLRASALRRHAGQVAFPGGRIDPEDDGPIDAALREAEEEIGLSRDSVTLLGFLDPYLTHSGFRIFPVVGLVTPPLSLLCNPDEVDEAFEVPMGFLMEPTNRQREERTREGITRAFYTMLYGDRKIWGVTAGILHNLHERLYA